LESVKGGQEISAIDWQEGKICSRFVLHSLTAEYRQHRVECCRNFTDENRDVLQRTVIGYKSWHFQFDPETKRRSMEQRGTKLRLQTASVKTMQIFFPMLPAELSTASLLLKAPIPNRYYCLGGMERLFAHAPCQKLAVPKQQLTAIA
jgi:hypothetical protein